MSRSEELNKIIALCDYAVSADDTRADWSLDFALFGFALSRLDEYIKEDRYFIFLKSFCDRFAAEKPLLGSREAAAPVLVVLEMYKRTKNEAYLSLAASVMNAVKKIHEEDFESKPKRSADGDFSRFESADRDNADRNNKDFEPNFRERDRDNKNFEPNFRTAERDNKNFESKPPRKTEGGFSSLKTADIISFLLADYMFLKYTGDADGLDVLVKKPKKYTASLMDKKDNLFHRSFFRSRIFQNAKIHFPPGRNYPARENVLALFALTLIAEGEDYIHRDINETIIRLTTAINNYRNVDGSYNAFFGNKRKSRSTGFITGKPADDGFDVSSFDPSVASYYAACCLKNASAGIVDAGYLETGKNAYMTAANSLVKERGAVYLPSMCKKNFFQGFLRLFSGFFSGGSNLSGIAGIVFAALEYERQNF
ncbi:MAG: hypothetical protein LBP62_02525 [Clostridiales bacterium]|jgi:hypothetical protein|nr:hypothetical protein [Clostridiales bacterium]